MKYILVIFISTVMIISLLISCTEPPDVSSSGSQTTRDTQPPVPGGAAEESNPLLVRQSINSTGNTITTIFTWTGAKDNVTPESGLAYRLFVSTSDLDESDPAYIETIETTTAIGDEYKSYETLTETISDLDKSEGTYYVYLVVSDKAGNKAVYDEFILDTQSPDPGNLGKITTETLTASVASISWSEATDNQSLHSEMTYQVYYIQYQNGDAFDTVAEVTTHGTPLDTAIGATTQTITNLDASIVYRAAVVVTDKQGNSALYASDDSSAPFEFTTEADNQEPDVSGVSISQGDTTSTSITVHWNAAVDDHTATEDLRYKLVVKDFSDTIVQTLDYDDVLNSLSAVIDGEAGLAAESNYTFILTVKDKANNESSEVYDSTNNLPVFATDADTAAPIPAGGSVDPTPADPHRGEEPSPPEPEKNLMMTADASDQDIFEMSWKSASDDHTERNSLEYRIYYADTAAEISDPEVLATNGTPIGNYTANMLIYDIDVGTDGLGLTAGATYYFTVAVKDSKGNTALYNTKEVILKNGIDFRVTLGDPTDDELTFDRTDGFKVTRGGSVTFTVTDNGYSNFQWSVDQDSSHSSISNGTSSTVTIDTTSLTFGEHQLSLQVEKSDGYPELSSIIFKVTN